MARLIAEGVGRYPAWRPAARRGAGHGAGRPAGAAGARARRRLAREVARLPLRAAGAFAAAWDVAHGQALVAVAAGPLDAGRPEHWLVRFTEAVG